MVYLGAHYSERQGLMGRRSNISLFHRNLQVQQILGRPCKAWKAHMDLIFQTVSNYYAVLGAKSPEERIENFSKMMENIKAKKNN